MVVGIAGLQFRDHMGTLLRAFSPIASHTHGHDYDRTIKKMLDMSVAYAAHRVEFAWEPNVKRMSASEPPGSRRIPKTANENMPAHAVARLPSPSNLISPVAYIPLGSVNQRGRLSEAEVQLDRFWAFVVSISSASHHVTYSAEDLVIMHQRMADKLAALYLEVCDGKNERFTVPTPYQKYRLTLESAACLVFPMFVEALMRASFLSDRDANFLDRIKTPEHGLREAIFRSILTEAYDAMSKDLRFRWYRKHKHKHIQDPDSKDEESARETSRGENDDGPSATAETDRQQQQRQRQQVPEVQGKAGADGGDV